MPQCGLNRYSMFLQSGPGPGDELDAIDLGDVPSTTLPTQVSDRDQQDTHTDIVFPHHQLPYRMLNRGEASFHTYTGTQDSKCEVRTHVMLMRMGWVRLWVPHHLSVELVSLCLFSFSNILCVSIQEVKEQIREELREELRVKIESLKQNVCCISTLNYVECVFQTMVDLQEKDEQLKTVIQERDMAKKELELAKEKELADKEVLLKAKDKELEEKDRKVLINSRTLCQQLILTVDLNICTHNQIKELTQLTETQAAQIRDLNTEKQHLQKTIDEMNAQMRVLNENVTNVQNQGSTLEAGLQQCVQQEQFQNFLDKELEKRMRTVFAEMVNGECRTLLIIVAALHLVLMSLFKAVTRLHVYLIKLKLSELMDNEVFVCCIIIM